MPPIHSPMTCARSLSVPSAGLWAVERRVIALFVAPVILFQYPLRAYGLWNAGRCGMLLM